MFKPVALVVAVAVVVVVTEAAYVAGATLNTPPAPQAATERRPRKVIPLLHDEPCLKKGANAETDDDDAVVEPTAATAAEAAR